MLENPRDLLTDRTHDAVIVVHEVEIQEHAPDTDETLGRIVEVLYRLADMLQGFLLHVGKIDVGEGHRQAEGAIGLLVAHQPGGALQACEGSVRLEFAKKKALAFGFQALGLFPGSGYLAVQVGGGLLTLVFQSSTPCG